MSIVNAVIENGDNPVRVVEEISGYLVQSYISEFEPGVDEETGKHEYKARIKAGAETYLFDSRTQTIERQDPPLILTE